MAVQKSFLVSDGNFEPPRLMSIDSKNAATSNQKEETMKRQIWMAAVVSGMVMVAGAAQAAGHREAPAFADLDLNGDGSLSLEELQAQGEARFAEADSDGDGALSAEELIAQAESRAADRVAAMIERFDENDDGLLQQSELPQRGNGDRAERMFDRVDADDDGVISAEEFEEARERMGERRGGGKGHRGRG